MHEGHRKRLTDKLASGEMLRDSELVELLLFFACPRKDVSGAAKNLIGTFGDLKGVIRADEAALAAVDGVGQNMAEYIVCTRKCLDAAKTNAKDFFNIIKTNADFCEFACARYKSGDVDPMELSVIGNDDKVLRILPIEDCAGARRAIMCAQRFKTVKGILLSIYRRGDESCQPTHADDLFVREVIKACKICALEFLDCGICGSDGFASYRALDQLELMFDCVRCEEYLKRKSME